MVSCWLSVCPSVCPFVHFCSFPDHNLSKYKWIFTKLTIYIVAIDHEIIFMVILSLPLIQEGQLSVSGERMCTILVNPLED